MKTALDRIIDYKRDEVARLKHETSLDSLTRDAQAQAPVRGFCQAMARIADTGENALICEMKRRSPSAGDILPGADPVAIAGDYERGGAACLSVLTDGPSFGGSLADFRQIRAAVSLPMLRKDFMIDPIQVLEARAAGADAVLVIMSCCDDALAEDLIDAATEHGMDSIVEVHDQDELARALRLGKGILGINNRDLKRMVTDLTTTEQLARALPRGTDFISESGINTTEDIQRLRQTGARRFLIGESLMKRADRAAHCARLRAAG